MNIFFVGISSFAVGKKVFLVGMILESKELYRECVRIFLMNIFVVGRKVFVVGMI